MASSLSFFSWRGGVASSLAFLTTLESSLFFSRRGGVALRSSLCLGGVASSLSVLCLGGVTPSSVTARGSSFSLSFSLSRACPASSFTSSLVLSTLVLLASSFLLSSPFASLLLFFRGGVRDLELDLELDADDDPELDPELSLRARRPLDRLLERSRFSLRLPRSSSPLWSSGAPRSARLSPRRASRGRSRLLLRLRARENRRWDRERLRDGERRALRLGERRRRRGGERRGEREAERLRAMLGRCGGWSASGNTWCLYGRKEGRGGTVARGVSTELEGGETFGGRCVMRDAIL